jgi:soluble lytic murein transglycosylase-like protein
MTHKQTLPECEEQQGGQGTTAICFFLGLLLIIGVALSNQKGAALASLWTTNTIHAAGPSSSYVTMAEQDAVQAGIPPTLFVRQMQEESGFEPSAESPAGAEGIAQFMPATASELGIDPWNPVQSLHAAAQLMASYSHHYGSYSAALAAYNCGSGCLDGATSRCGTRWIQCLPAQTQIYIRIITQA